MNIEQLRHILRAAAAITGEKVFVVIGSQAILGSHPDAPRSLRKSVEGDTYPKNHPDKAIEVDGAIGELSPFHQEFGYYAHGVASDNEHLIMDAGSKDDTAEVVARFPHAQFFQEPDKGMTDGRVYGIKPFKDENLSLVVDGVLYHLYRVKKGILRVLRG